MTLSAVHSCYWEEFPVHPTIPNFFRLGYQVRVLWWVASHLDTTNGLMAELKALAIQRRPIKSERFHGYLLMTEDPSGEWEPLGDNGLLFKEFTPPSTW